MLMPKKVKYRKQQRGRMAGKAWRGSSLAFGDYGLKALSCGWITDRQIEAARVAMTRSIKRGGKVWIRLFPDKPITKKPAETRMGKGKGAPDHRDPLLRRALALTHTGFGGLLGNRLIGEEPDPHLAAALDRTGHGDTRRLDLPVRHPAALERLQAEIAERDRRTAPRLAGHAAALLLPVLHLLGHHHGGLLLGRFAFRLGRLVFLPRFLLPGRLLLRRH